jgi:ketosteroid isomerase-like protein
MSKDNVELIRAFVPSETDLIEVLKSDDPVAAFLGSTDAVSPDVEVTFAASRSGGPGLVYHGPDGLVEGWRDWLTPWESYRFEVEDLVDAGDNVVMTLTVAARTERHGVELVHRPAAVWTIEGGRIVAIRFYLEHHQAFEYAGLAAP